MITRFEHCSQVFTTFTKSTAVIIQNSTIKLFTKFLLLMFGYDAASAQLLDLCKQISSTSRLRILTKLKLRVMRPFLRIWIEDLEDHGIGQARVCQVDKHHL